MINIMRFNIVLLPVLCLLANILESKPAVITDFPDHTSENEGILIVLASTPETIVLYWNLTDGDVFDDSYAIRVSSRCLYNAAARTRLRKKDEYDHEETYEIVPDHLKLEEVLCKERDSFKYSSMLISPNELKIYINQTSSPGIVDEIEIEKIPRDIYSLFKKKSAKVVTGRSGQSYPFIVSSPDTGEGCFQALDLDDISREVHIYWRKSPSHQVNIQTYLFDEKEDYAVLVRTTSFQDIDDSSMTTIIGSLRYRFIIEFFNEKGEIIGTPKVVNIPSKKNQIPKLDVIATFNEKSNSNALILPRVPHTNEIINYTVFLIDNIEGRVIKNITDFMHVPSDVRRIEIEADQLLCLGISLNTENSSTGLYLTIPGF